MSQATSFDSRTGRVLKEEKLDDLSQYSEDGFFDEIPLYSRFAQVSFLEALGREGADKVLIEFGLRYMESVVAHTMPVTKMLAAVTVVDFGEGDPVVPHIFFCNGLVKERLEGKLVLREPTKPFSLKLVNLVEALSLAGKHQWLHDKGTIPGFILHLVGL